MSSSHRLARNEESQLSVRPLNDSTTKQSLNALSQLLSSCYGPNGYLKNIHNDSGGHVTVTSTSARLFQAISFTKPILRLIVNSISSHVQNFMDQGLFSGILALSLVESYLEGTKHPHLVMNVLEYLQNECCIYLNDPDCCCKFKINLSSSDHLLSLVKSTLGSKPLCGYTEDSLNYLSRQVLQIFLKATVTDRSEINNSINNIHYVLLQGYKLEDTHIVDGLLFETPQIPSYRNTRIQCKKIQHECTHGQVHNEAIRVFLVDVSMSGDSENYIHVTYNLGENVDFSSVVLKQLLNIAEYAVSHDVGLLACQKVIHPQVKKYLRENNVFVLERLGNQFTASLSKLSGARCVGCESLPTDTGHFGCLAAIRHCVYKSRSFVQLEGCPDADMCTVVLCNSNEEALEETKGVFASSLHSLQLSLQSPWCLYGAGCWQTVLAVYISKQAEKLTPSWSEELQASTTHVNIISRLFINSLLKTVLALDIESKHLIDSYHGHHWLLPQDADIDDLQNNSCACGQINFKPGMKFHFLGKELMESDFCQLLSVDETKAVVVDNFAGCLHALQTAIGTTSMVVGIQQIITEK